MSAKPNYNPDFELMRAVRQVPELEKYSRTLEKNYTQMAEGMNLEPLPADLMGPPEIPSTGEGIPAQAPKPRAKRYDWALAAEMLAQGFTANEVARRLGCTRQAIYRALKRSRGFRKGVDRLRYQQQAETEAYMEGLRQDLVEKLAEKALEGNVSALRYLLEKLNLTQARYTWSSSL